VKVVLLTTARGQRPATIATLKEQLGLVPEDGTEVGFISWYYPKRPLPVQTHLVVGPDFTVARHARILPVAEPSLGPEDEGGDDDAPPLTAESAGTDASAAPLAPVYHPKRVAKALTWRANKARLAVRGNPTVARVRNSTKLRKLRNKVAPGSLGSRFALACLQARNVRAEIDSADVVVALDANTHRAAWLLARRHPDPAFVVGTAAGKRVLEERSAHR
jgi:hypothetical protein